MSEKFKEGSSEYYDRALSEEEDYYVKAFKRLDETGKHTWNCAAFFFGGTWMLYRKMYLYFICLHILLWIAGVFFGVIVFGAGSQHMKAFGWLIEICVHLLFGYFGNSLYYASVKEKIKEGFHLMEQYRPTSISSCLIPVFGFLIGLADQISFKKQVRIRVENVVNEETIRAYLNPNKENPRIVKIAKAVAWLSWPIIITALVFFGK